jgi:hypothetical protein
MNIDSDLDIDRDINIDDKYYEEEEEEEKEEKKYVSKKKFDVNLSEQFRCDENAIKLKRFSFTEYFTNHILYYEEKEKINNIPVTHISKFLKMVTNKIVVNFKKEDDEYYWDKLMKVVFESVVIESNEDSQMFKKIYDQLTQKSQNLFEKNYGYFIEKTSIDKATDIQNILVRFNSFKEISKMSSTQIKNIKDFETTKLFLTILYQHPRDYFTMKRLTKSAVEEKLRKYLNK